MISAKHGPGGIACCGLIVACCQPLAQCPWAAPAQSLEFVTTWYEVYREGFTGTSTRVSSADASFQVPPARNAPGVSGSGRHAKALLQSEVLPSSFAYSR
jgi:hypothetical protein